VVAIAAAKKGAAALRTQSHIYSFALLGKEDLFLLCAVGSWCETVSMYLSMQLFLRFNVFDAKPSTAAPFS
jgi:hypothetical protein